MATRKTLEAQLQALKNKICNCCKTLPSTDGVPTEPPTNGQTVKIDLSTGIIYYWDGDSWEELGTGGGEPIYEEITYAAASTLVTNGTVSPGVLYKITDAANDGVYVHGATEDSFSNEGWRIMLVPTPGGYDDGGSVTYNSIVYTTRGLYNLHKSNDLLYTQDDFVIFNGHFWRLTSPITLGSSPVSISDFQAGLDTNEFTRIEKNDPLATLLYIPKLFSIKYDFDNDWIYEQSDEYNNVVGMDYQFYRLFGALILPVNPIDYTDWSLADFTNDSPTMYAPVVNNRCPLGFYNNSSYQPTTNRDTVIINNNDVACIINNFSVGSLTIRNNISTKLKYGTTDFGGIFNNTASTIDCYIENNYLVRGIVGNLSLEKCWKNKVDYIYSNVVNQITENIGGDIQLNGGMTVIEKNNFVTINSNTGAATITSNFVNEISLNALVGGEIKENIVLIITNNTSGNIGGNIVATEISGNSSAAIESNTCYSISDNANNGTILKNKATVIELNTNNGDISNNIVGGDIYSNSNDGLISENVCTGNINGNENLGVIGGNRTAFVSNNSSGITNIQENSNPNGIYNNTDGGGGPWAIYSNVNNGYISAAQTADVTDPLVNK